MKRFLILMLGILYFAVSSGFTVHVHYCMGHIVEANLSGSEGEDHHCTHCGMKKKKGGNGCCREEAKIVKHAPDHAPAKELKWQAPLVYALPALPLLVPQSVAGLHAGEYGQLFQAHAPPGPPQCPPYLAIRNLRI